MIKKRMFIWMLAFVFILSMVSPMFAQEKPKPPAWKATVVKDWVAKAKAEIKVAPAADVKAAIDKKKKMIILDVRDPDEFAGGHLAGAINQSRGTIEFFIWDKNLDKNAIMYVYCKTGGRAALATKTLNDLGFKNAVMMDPSLEGWVKAGYPVVK